MSQKLLGIAARNHRCAFGVEKYTVVGDPENARKLMCDDNDGRAQIVANLEDEIIEQTGGDGIESR
jgi:hypothetical protein